MRKIFPFMAFVALWCMVSCSQKREQVTQDDVAVIERSDGSLPAIDDERYQSEESDRQPSVEEELEPSYDDDDDSDIDYRHEGRHPIEVRHVDDEAPAASNDLLAVRGGQRGRVLKREGYTTSYNAEWRIPNWVAWCLTRDHATGPFKRPKMAYHEDVEVAEPRAKLDDYKGSHYSRGHMCPSGDNKWDATAQNQSFLLTNMCPQDRTLNGGDWNELEMRCRRWAERYGEVYIVAGPIVSKSNPETIGRNHVVVPDKFFKVVLCTEGTPRALGFIYDNRQDHHKKMREYVVSVDEVERITGLDFFSALPDDVERRIEEHADLDKWK